MTPSQALGLVLDEEHATAIVDHRKAMKKPLTEFAAKLLAKEFAKCSDPNSAAEAMLLNGWRGFNASWINKPDQRVTHYQQRQPNQPRNIFEASSMLLAELMEADNGTEPNANDRRIEQDVRNLPPPQRQH